MPTQRMPLEPARGPFACCSLKKKMPNWPAGTPKALRVRLLSEILWLPKTLMDADCPVELGFAVQ